MRPSSLQTHMMQQTICFYCSNAAPSSVSLAHSSVLEAALLCDSAILMLSLLSHSSNVAVYLRQLSSSEDKQLQTGCMVEGPTSCASYFRVWNHEH